jgi:hypothetical protein
VIVPFHPYFIFLACNSHTETLFKNSEILPLHHLIKYFKLMFMYDYCNNLLPISFENVWPTNAQKRNRDNPVNERDYKISTC